MMRSLLASLLLASLAGCVGALGGCAVNGELGDGETESDPSEVAGALSAYGSKLVGAFATADGAADFDNIVLKADGTYFTSKAIVCITTPCDPIRDQGKFVGNKPRGGGYLGGLRLVSSTGVATQYSVSLGTPNESFKLSRDGKTFFAYDSTSSYCHTTSDCAGQSFAHIMCVGSAVCADNRCGWKCGGGEPVPEPTCDYSDPTRNYVGKSVEECQLVRFFCADGMQMFSNDCGCGCEKAPEPVLAPCIRTGCSGQICAAEQMITTCEYRAEYACYANAECARDASGACGWVKTPELAACLESPPSL